MTRLECPHCRKPGISRMRKLFLGPGVSTTCRICGKKVGVAYTAMLAIIPFLAAIVFSAFVESFLLKAALWVGGFIVMSAAHMRSVTLQAR